MVRRKCRRRDQQDVDLGIDYSNAGRDPNQCRPGKWLLTIPHVVTFFLDIGACFTVLVAWSAILRTGHTPRAVRHLGRRWDLWVQAYVLVLVTDRYPPSSHY